MRYEVLGPLQVIDGGDEFRLSAHKAEIVLAALLIRSNQVITIGQLLTELWGDDPPHRAAAGVHVYISQLRKFLKRPRCCASAIVTRSPGYLLELGADEIDFVHFQKAMCRGRHQLEVGSASEAAKALETALAFWRGPALGGLRGTPIVGGFAAALEESRLECLEMLAEANLMLKRHRDSVSQLYSLIAEYPLHEAFYELLMLALYRSNRQADALSVYRAARAALKEALGLEPCRALRDLHHAILSEDNRLDTREPAGNPRASAISGS